MADKKQMQLQFDDPAPPSANIEMPPLDGRSWSGTTTDPRFITVDVVAQSEGDRYWIQVIDLKHDDVVHTKKPVAREFVRATLEVLLQAQAVSTSEAFDRVLVFKWTEEPNAWVREASAEEKLAGNWFGEIFRSRK